mgnify:CR=1 FL=1
MLENFIKSLGFLSVNANNTKHVACEKNMFKFEDETLDKYWRCFYAFYKTGYTDACNKIGVLAIKGVNDEL